MKFSIELNNNNVLYIVNTSRRVKRAKNHVNTYCKLSVGFAEMGCEDCPKY